MKNILRKIGDFLLVLLNTLGEVLEMLFQGKSTLPKINFPVNYFEPTFEEWSQRINKAEENQKKFID